MPLQVSALYRLRKTERNLLVVTLRCIHVREKPSVTLNTYLALSKFMRRVGSVSEVADARTFALQGEMLFVEPVTCLKPLFDIAVARRASERRLGGENRMGAALKTRLAAGQTSHRLENDSNGTTDANAALAGGASY